MRLVLELDPTQFETGEPLILIEMQTLNETGQSEAVKAMIRMLADLRTNGRQSRFVRALKGLPIFELKTASRGGLKGGARVYLFFSDDDAAHIVNCEVKDNDQPSTQKLKVAVLSLLAYKRRLEEDQDAN